MNNICTIFHEEILLERVKGFRIELFKKSENKKIVQEIDCRNRFILQCKSLIEAIQKTLKYSKNVSKLENCITVYEISF